MSYTGTLNVVLYLLNSVVTVVYWVYNERTVICANTVHILIPYTVVV